MKIDNRKKSVIDSTSKGTVRLLDVNLPHVLKQNDQGDKTVSEYDDWVAVTIHSGRLNVTNSDGK